MLSSMPPHRADIEAYQGVLNDIGTRLTLVRDLFRQPLDIAHQEWIAVELRIVLELIVLGSLLTNREAISKVSSVLKIKKVLEAQKIVERVNPEYWPTPIPGTRQLDGTLVGEPYVTAEFPQKADWGREHGFLSELVTRGRHTIHRGTWQQTRLGSRVCSSGLRCCFVNTW